MKKLSGLPVFLFLLPVFFVFHGYVENIGFIGIADCLPLLGLYLLLAIASFLLFYPFFRDRNKAALMSFYGLCFYFFFGALHDFLKARAAPLSRYSILLPLFVASGVVVFLLLRKNKTFRPLILFLNCLFLLYLLVDAGAWMTKLYRNPIPRASASSPLSPYYRTADPGPRPDIYLLLFDEYSASRTLRSVYQYDNSGLDSFLQKEGFYLPRGCRSNYYYTLYSMASMLNLQYIDGLPDRNNLRPDDNARMLEDIRTSEAVKFLIARGYTIVNKSPWDLPGNPGSMDQPFIPLRSKLISRRTLPEYVSRDIGGWLNIHFRDSLVVSNEDIMNLYNYNTRTLAGTMEESARASTSPRFVYMHVFMPHSYYLFDSLRHMRPIDDIRRCPPDKNRPRYYFEYLPYVNAHIRELITTIKRNTSGKAVILFMSDHGHRFSPDNVAQPYFFDNQNAIYFPDGDYSRFNDSVTNVNQFRIVYDKLFRLNLPLLKDSTIFLHMANEENAFN
jgi:hypothetical protein